MHLLKSTIVALTTFAFCLACSWDQAKAPSEPRSRRLQEYLRAQADLGRFSGAVVVTEREATLFRGGFGFANVAQRTRFKPETPMPIASLSKMFTAIAVLKQRDDGRLALEDSICGHIDDCPRAWEPVTLHHLLHHTSGIPDYEERLELGSTAYFDLLTRPGSSSKIVADAKTRPLDFAPGTKFHYSNTGYLLLGFVVQRVAGRPFDEVLADTVLRPAGLASSGSIGSATAPKAIAAGYTHGDIGWKRFLEGVALDGPEMIRVPDLALAPPAGDAGMYATADDLARWSDAMDGSAVVPAQLAEEAFTPDLEGYAAGWIVDQAFEHERQRHTGILPGFTSTIVRFPEMGITIVVLCNLDRARVSTIVRDLSAIALGAPYDLPVRGTLAALTADQYEALEGGYAGPAYERYRVSKDPDLLAIAREGMFTAGLIPLSATSFYMPLADGRVTFTLDSDGRGAEVNLRYAGDDHPAHRAQ